MATRRERLEAKAQVDNEPKIAQVAPSQSEPDRTQLHAPGSPEAAWYQNEFERLSALVEQRKAEKPRAPGQPVIHADINYYLTDDESNALSRAGMQLQYQQKYGAADRVAEKRAARREQMATESREIYDWEEHFIDPSTVDPYAEYDKMTLTTERDFVATPQITLVRPRGGVLREDPLDTTMGWVNQNRTKLNYADFAYAMAKMRATEVERDHIGLTYETPEGVRIHYAPPGTPEGGGTLHMDMYEAEHPNLQYGVRKVTQLDSRGLPRRTSAGGYLKMPLDKFFLDNAKSRTPRHPVWGTDFKGIQNTMELLGAEPRGSFGSAIQYELPGGHMVNVGADTPPYLYPKRIASPSTDLGGQAPAEFWTEQYAERQEELETLRMHPTEREWHERKKAMAAAETETELVLADSDNDGIADVVDPDVNTPLTLESLAESGEIEIVDDVDDSVKGLLPVPEHDADYRYPKEYAALKAGGASDEIAAHLAQSALSTLDTQVEVAPAVTTLADTDGDGLVDLIDPDKDGDGVPDNAIEIAMDAPELYAPIVIVTEVTPVAEPVEVIVAESASIAYYEPKPAKAKKGRSRADIISAAASKASGSKKKSAPKRHPFLSKSESRRR